MERGDTTHTCAHRTLTTTLRSVTTLNTPSRMGAAVLLNPTAASSRDQSGQLLLSEENQAGGGGDNGGGPSQEGSEAEIWV